MQPYTPNTGLTVPGQQLGNLQDVLSQISGMAQQSGQDPTAAVENSFAMGQNAAQPQSFQNATNQLTQQAGIPALQNQQQNLGQVFQMWLADQNLSSKYASPQLLNANNPVYNSGLQGQAQPGVTASSYQGIQDPYLANPAAILNAVVGQGGYQGATNPSQNTAAMTAVPSSAANISNTLSNLISTEQGLVNTQSGNYQTNYSNIMNALGSLLANQSSTAFANAQPGTPQSVQKSLQSLKSDVLKKMTLKQIMAKYSTDPNLDANKILQIYNENSPWGPAKEDPQTLANMYGVTGGFGKVASSSSASAKAKQDLLENTRTDALRGFGDLINSYMKNSANIAGVHMLNPLSNNYKSQLDIYSRQLSAALKASKSTANIKAIEQNLPGEFSVNPDASLKAHFAQLLDANALRVVTDKNGNVSVVDNQTYDPSKMQTVDVNNLDLSQIQTILSSL